MLGTLNFNQKQATIIGAGVSGLLIGYRLSQLGFEVEIFEASARTGGLIETEQTPLGPVEHAAHSLLVNDEVAKFMAELGLNLIAVQPKSKARFIVRDGKPRRMPLRFGEILSTIKHLFSRPALTQNPSSLTLEEWGNTYVGKKATQYLLSPFVTGIFACSPSDLQASLSFPKLVPTTSELSLWKHLRSLKTKNKKPRAQMMTLEKGLQSLTEALTNKILSQPKNKIHLQSPIQDLTPFLGRPNLILSTPAPITAKLLATIDPASSKALLDVRYSSLISMTAFFNASDFPQSQPPRGVGVLIPRSENFRLLGCLYNSSAFAHRAQSANDVSLTLMLGGTSDPQALSLTDDQIREIISRELHLLFGVKSPAKLLKINRWPQAIPLYNASLQKCRSTLSSGFCAQTGRVIFTNYSNEVSIRGMIESLCQISL